MVTRNFMCFLVGTFYAVSAAATSGEISLAALEQRVHEIDGQLAQLANYNLGGGVGAIGSRSRGYDTAAQDEWVEIEFGDAVPLDQVVLVPAIRRDGVKRMAFPWRFVCGPEPAGTASEKSSAHLLAAMACCPASPP